MFERYTEPARRALFFARYEAAQAGSRAISPEHLLLGVVRSHSGILGEILDNAGLSLADIREAVVDRAAPSPRAVAADESRHLHEVPFADDTKRALQCGAEESDRFLHTHIGSEHLLLGILRVESSAAAFLLRERGLSLDAVRGHLQKGVPQPGFRLAPSTRPFQRGTSSTRDLEGWTLQGFFLRPLLAEVYGIAETRMELAADLDERTRYDCSLVLPPGDRDTDMTRAMRENLERHFGVTVTMDTRTTDAYVVRAPHGEIAAVKESDSAGGGGLGAISFGGFELPSRDETPTDVELRQMAMDYLQALGSGGTRRGPIRNLSLSGSVDMSTFCALIEANLDRPVMDETGLSGSYAVEVQIAATTAEEFIDGLESQLGLVMTPAQRDVTMLVVRSRLTDGA